MAEPKRVSVTQVEADKPVEKKDKPRLSYRFVLPLVDSTEKTCPEFSYNDLLKKALGDKRGADNYSDDEDDPFGKQDQADQDKLLSIAKSFEEKYAPKDPPKKKKKGPYNRLQEFVDLGDGYDETDPFIDNAEAYDELVPSCLTTQHGGFYINSGKLDFRAVSDSDEDIKICKKKRKKNQITSDSENETSGPKKTGRKKKFREEEELRKKKRKKLGSGEFADKPLIKKKKIDKEKLGLKIVKNKNTTVVHLLNNSSAATSNGLPSHSSKPVEADSSLNSQQQLSSAEQVRANMESAIDAVISQSRQPSPPTKDEESVGSSNCPSPVGNLIHNSQVPGLVPSLPENLPENIVEIVQELKIVAMESDGGKSKFFTPTVNQMLLAIENGTCQFSAGMRSSIYSHLAAFLPCGKETLIKRAKKLRMEQHDDKIREPLAKIKEAINLLMPSLAEKHQAEVQATQEKKKNRNRLLEMVGGNKDPGSTESDDEAEKPEGEKQKRIVAPRRKFDWTTETKNLLNNVIRIKMDQYATTRARNQTQEDYLKIFLDQELKPLWPQGWMHTRMLLKESRAVHHKWTGMASVRPRKPGPLSLSSTKLSQGSGSKPSTPVAGASTISMVTSTSTVSMPAPAHQAATSLTPSVQRVAVKPPPPAESSSSSSSSSSDSSYTGSESNSSVSQPAPVNSSSISTAASSVQPEVKSAGSFGFDTGGLRTPATNILQNLSVTLGRIATTNVTAAAAATAVPVSPVVCSSSSAAYGTSYMDKFAHFAVAGNRGSESGSTSLSQTAASKHPITTSSVGVSREHKAAVSLTSTAVTAGAPSSDPQNSGKFKPADKPHLTAALKGMYVSLADASTSVTPKPQTTSTTKAQVLQQQPQPRAPLKEKPQAAKVFPQYQVSSQTHSGQQGTTRQDYTVSSSTSDRALPNSVGSTQPDSQVAKLLTSPITQAQKAAATSSVAGQKSGSGQSQNPQSLISQRPQQKSATPQIQIVQGSAAVAALGSALKLNSASSSQSQTPKTVKIIRANLAQMLHRQPLDSTSVQSVHAASVASVMQLQKPGTLTLSSPSASVQSVHAASVMHPQKPGALSLSLSSSTASVQSVHAASVMHSQKPGALSLSSPTAMAAASVMHSQKPGTLSLRSPSASVQSVHAASVMHSQKPANHSSQQQQRVSPVSLQQQQQRVSPLALQKASVATANAASGQHPGLPVTISHQPHKSPSHSSTPQASAFTSPKQPAAKPILSSVDRVSSTTNVARAKAATSSQQPRIIAFTEPPRTKASAPSISPADRKPAAVSAHASGASAYLHNAAVSSRTFPVTSVLSHNALGLSLGQASSKKLNTGAVSSTTGEPKIGGLTLSQIQAQTLKASQKTHLPTAQYSTGQQPATSSATQAYSPTGLPSCAYGSTSPRGNSQAIPGYQVQRISPPGLTNPPSSPSLRQTPEQNYTSGSIYGLHRSPQAMSGHTPSPNAHSLYSSIPASPNSSLTHFGQHYQDRSPSQHRY